MLLEAAAKAVVYVALVLLCGTAASYWWIRSRWPAGWRADPQSVERSLRRVGVAASAALVVGLGLRVWAHTAAAFGIGEAFSTASLDLVARQSRWGGQWQWQMAAAAATLGSYLAVRPGQRTRWAIAGSFSAATCLTQTLTGHAAGSSLRMALHATHLLGAGTWLGTLAVLWWLARTAAPDMRAGLFVAFSPVALAGATALVTSGVVVAWTYVGTLSNVWTTAYGRALAVKLVAVACVVLCGFVNWRGVRRTDGTQAPPVAGLELTLTLLVLLVTAALTEMAHP